MSFPRGDSINDGTALDLCSVRYTSLDEAVKILQTCGVGALMAKADIVLAFLLLPVHPDDYCLLAFLDKPLQWGALYLARLLRDLAPVGSGP